MNSYPCTKVSVQVNGAKDAKDTILEMAAMNQLSSDQDVVIFCEDGNEIKCNRMVLSASGPVLEAMFKPGSIYQEALTRRIQMTDASKPVVQAFVDYLNTGTLQEPKKHSTLAVELLKVAHKYQVTSLEQSIITLFQHNDYKWLGVEGFSKLYDFAGLLPSSDIGKSIRVQDSREDTKKYKYKYRFGIEYETDPILPTANSCQKLKQLLCGKDAVPWIAIVCGYIVAAIALNIFDTIPAIVIGSLYLDECPMDNSIPLMLIIGGTLELLIRLVLLHPAHFNINREDHPGKTGFWITYNIGSPRVYWTAFQWTFRISWLVHAAVKTYGAHWIVNWKEKQLDNYCNKVLYIYTYGYITVVFAGLGLVLMVYSLYSHHRRFESPKNGKVSTST